MNPEKTPRERQQDHRFDEIERNLKYAESLAIAAVGLALIALACFVIGAIAGAS